MGRPVEQLWGDYAKAVEAESKPGDQRHSTDVAGSEDEEMVLVEKHDAPDLKKENAPPGTTTDECNSSRSDR